MTDSEDYNDGFNPSRLDKERILMMELGDSVEAESGLFSVFLYKDGYNLFFTSNQRNDNHVFETAGELFYYLVEIS